MLCYLKLADELISMQEQWVGNRTSLAAARRTEHVVLVVSQTASLYGTGVVA